MNNFASELKKKAIAYWLKATYPFSYLSVT